MIVNTSAVLCLVLLSPSLVMAEPVNQWPTHQYDEIAAKLIGQGYRDVRISDEMHGVMSAYDENGSEVFIIVDVANRQVVSTSYVHAADE